MSLDERCRSCGHVLGIGRFCVNCGHPKDEAVLDEVPTTAEPAVVDRGSSTAPWWAAAAVAVVLALGGGGFVLLGGSGDQAVDAPVAVISPAPDDPSITLPATPRSTPRSSTPVGPDGPDGPDTSDGPVDVARTAEATPPDTAAPSRDVRGNAVRYEASNMLDGQPDTAWRMPGDASGQEVVFRLDSPTVVSAVGLVNGYAKVEPGYDGYAVNRRITAVEWVFDDGTVVRQSFAEEASMQGVEVDDVTTTTITLRIVSVTSPAPRPAGRDYTAISDVAFAGVPA